VLSMIVAGLMHVASNHGMDVSHRRPTTKHFLTVSCLLVLLAVPCTGRQEPSPQSKISLRILYAGEAETIALGFAPGKAYDSVGIGRHGNFMLWGWSATPPKMTPADQKRLYKVPDLN